MEVIPCYFFLQMGTLKAKEICVLLVLLTCHDLHTETLKPIRKTTMTAVFTTKPTSPEEVDERELLMSPPRNEHQSKLVETVIFEPQPRIMLSRSTYKVASFVDFMPYKEAFKKFETFLRRFKNNINNPEHVDPLINVNQTKGESWKGPKEAFFRVSCKKECL